MPALNILNKQAEPLIKDIFGSECSTQNDFDFSVMNQMIFCHTPKFWFVKFDITLIVRCVLFLPQCRVENDRKSEVEWNDFVGIRVEWVG